MTLDEAIEKSCNTYFYTLGEKLDVDQIHKWSTALGLGQFSGVDLPHEVTQKKCKNASIADRTRDL